MTGLKWFVIGCDTCRLVMHMFSAFSLTAIFLTYRVSHSSIIHSDVEKRDHFQELGGDKEHLDHHDVEFDHEAFLGKQLEKEFHELSPTESKHRLKLIAEKIDKDKDGYITNNEMVHWIKYIQKQNLEQDCKRVWSYFDKHAEDDLLSWDEYDQVTFGELTEKVYPQLDDLKERKMTRKQDQRRFQMSDLDKDRRLNFTEFNAFLHPEHFDHMIGAYVMDTIEEFDHDSDGFISFSEYLGKEYQKPNSIDKDEWMAPQKEDFNKWKDLNKDGKLDYAEVQQWISPSDYDSATAESRHLIYHADKNKDDKLTQEEMISNYSLFVGSHVTDTIMPSRDEF